jgi:DNA-binding MarR family transcriptional regulator
MDATPELCANELIEVVPLMMRIIRAQVRSHTSPELSVGQFRALAFLGRNERAMLGDVGNFLGLSLPAASKLIEVLVAAELVTRKTDLDDRRKVVLTLTAAGQVKYAAALKESADFLAARVSALSAPERIQLAEALESLRSIFVDDPPETRHGSAKVKHVVALV